MSLRIDPGNLVGCRQEPTPKYRPCPFSGLEPAGDRTRPAVHQRRPTQQKAGNETKGQPTTSLRSRILASQQTANPTHKGRPRDKGGLNKAPAQQEGSLCWETCLNRAPNVHEDREAKFPLLLYYYFTYKDSKNFHVVKEPQIFAILTVPQTEQSPLGKT